MSCANKKNAHQPVVDQEQPNTSNPNLAPGEVEHTYTLQKVEKADSLFAYMRRGACFGTCPVYEIHIYKSGFAVYNGINHTKMVGEHTAMLSKEDLKKLQDYAIEIGYDKFADKYDNTQITDLPSVTTSLVLDGKRKQVYRRYGYPSALKNFESKIDDLIIGAVWTAKAKD